tara:strand:- start:656 stop:1099 length:444 start_codon:yes stop_codon:yes gene_type:complete
MSFKVVVTNIVIGGILSKFVYTYLVFFITGSFVEAKADTTANEKDYDKNNNHRDKHSLSKRSGKILKPDSIDPTIFVRLYPVLKIKTCVSCSCILIWISNEKHSLFNWKSVISSNFNLWSISEHNPLCGIHSAASTVKVDVHVFILV